MHSVQPKDPLPCSSQSKRKTKTNIYQDNDESPGVMASISAYLSEKEDSECSFVSAIIRYDLKACLLLFGQRQHLRS